MLFDIMLVSAALLCSLVSGFLLGFAVVAMPGLATLDDRSFIRGFQVMDRVIQNRQPVFMLVWVGSVVTLLAALILGMGLLAGVPRALLVLATLVYLLGVQVPTATINVPLNNEIQTVDVDAVNAAQAIQARQRFEGRWTRWNAFRTALSCAASLALLLLLLWR